MTAIILRDTTRPARAIEALVAWHGFWPVARALLAQLPFPRSRGRAVPLTNLDALPDHLRRDLGLPPRGAGPPGIMAHLRKPV